MKNFVLSLLLLASMFSMHAAEPSQYGYKAVEQRYGSETYRYMFSVKDGIVNWTYKGPNGNMSDSFYCDSYVLGDIITSECEGIVYWYFAGRFIWEMVEEHGKFDKTLFTWGREALEKSLKCFAKAKETSPDAFDRVLTNYDYLMKGINGELDLWSVLCDLSYFLTEHALQVEDLYNYNF